MQIKKAVESALIALAAGETEKAGDTLAHALEQNESEQLAKCLALLKNGDIERAIFLLEQMVPILDVEKQNKEPSKQTEKPLDKALDETAGKSKESVQEMSNPDMYLYVPDREKPSTWKLPIAEDNGAVTVAQLGRAAAALGPGFRGQPVDLPPDAKKTCARKLISLYREHKAPPPDYLYGIAGETETKEASLAMEAVAGMEGKEWEVVLIRAGRSLNKNYYPPEALQRAVPLFEGAKAYDSHVTPEELKAHPGRKVGELLGWFDGVHWDEKRESVVGRFHAAATWLREMMLNAYKEGKRDLVGFSIDAYVNSNAKQMEGQDVNYVESFETINSVDVVCEPAAGGEVIRVVASADNPSGTIECNSRKKVEPLVGDASEDEGPMGPLVKGKRFGGKGKMTKEEIVEALKLASPEDRVLIAEMLKAEFDKDAEKVVEDEGKEETEEVNPVLERAVYNLELKDSVRESGLTKDAQAFILDLFKDKVASKAEDIKRAIESQRALLDKTVKANVVLPTISARPTFDVNAGQAVLNRIMGVASPDESKYLADNHIGWMGVREWYLNFTGDEDFMGIIAPHRVTEAAVTTTTANSVVKNALNKLIAKKQVAWEARQWWKPIVGEEDDTTIQTITAVKEASLGALGTLAEGETYPELTYSDAEETGTFSKYGAFLGVTLESFMKDDLNALRNLPNRLVDSWNFAMSDLVSATFTDAAGAGPTLTETARALFNTTDANLGTTALSYASAVAARIAFRKLTALGNARRIGLLPKFMLVPPDLEATALQILKSEKDPDNAENGINILQNAFTPIVVNSWTDTNNWYLLADPNECTVIQLHYYRGQRTPQLFTADSESSGALFTNDTIRYKTRFFCAKLIVDFRGGYGVTVT